MYIEATMGERRKRTPRNVDRVIVSLPLRRELHARLKARSQEEDAPLVAVVRQAIQAYLERPSSSEAG